MIVEKIIRKNKKAISELVSYVLLIVLAIAMATAAWFFLKPYAENPLREEACPEKVSVILENYSCNSTHITYTLKNKGLHNVTGIKLAITKGSEIEYDFWMHLPECGEIQNCSSCGFGVDCLPVNGNISGTVSYLKFGKIDQMIIYPMRYEKGFYHVCTAAISKIPIKNCEARTTPQF